MKASVVVTGGAGFVGSHLRDRLLDGGCTVLALDDLSTGDLSHLAPLRSNPKFRFLHHDISEPLPPEVHDADRIFNLACPASLDYDQRRPVHTRGWPARWAPGDRWRWRGPAARACCKRRPARSTATRRWTRRPRTIGATPVLRLTGSRSRIEHHPRPADDPLRRRPDITPARRELDWQPRATLEAGLQRTIDHLRSQQALAAA